MSDPQSYIADNRESFLADLAIFVRFPSISSLSNHDADTEECARWLAGRLQAAGMTRTQVFPTDGHPIVYAEWLGAPGRPTILVYGHYDVQPVDPIGLWSTPPFELSVRNGEAFGRGASDDKGQVLMHVVGVESYLKTTGALPVNLKFVIEGEEEIGSENFDRWVEDNATLLAADAIVVSDTSLFAKGMPSICYGLRGLCYFQIDVDVASADLHSGSFGGGVANPIEVLAKILAQLKDENGHITIPGFYDDVLPISDAERTQLAKLPHSDDEFLASTGAPALFGETSYTTLERIWARPTLDPNGIWGGFMGEGMKTVLPASAHAKVSCRLVPNQNPQRIAELFEAYISRLAPSYATVVVQWLSSGNPVLTPLDHPVTRAGARAVEAGFGVSPVFVRSGGSVPVVATLQEQLDAPAVLIGIALPDDHAHAPNERLDLDTWYSGIATSARLWEELAGL